MDSKPGKGTHAALHPPPGSGTSLRPHPARGGVSRGPRAGQLGRSMEQQRAGVFIPPPRTLGRRCRLGSRILTGPGSLEATVSVPTPACSVSPLPTGLSGLGNNPRLADFSRTVTAVTSDRLDGSDSGHSGARWSREIPAAVLGRALTEPPPCPHTREPASRAGLSHHGHHSPRDASPSPQAEGDTEMGWAWTLSPAQVEKTRTLKQRPGWPCGPVRSALHTAGLSGHTA